MDKISMKGLALSLGTIWSLYILSMGWGSTFGWGTAFVNAFSEIYIGYGPGFIGGIIGAIWAFFDGAFAGVFIALIYNWSINTKKKQRATKKL
ncbi:MAG: bacteriophage holin [Candidatus Marsarchaeota archaeon]|jgi:hypothetical protein|nr:bacteriophage holin [Candidatus Marsarchaeota archaeon]